MQVFRLARKKYARPLSGKGAAIRGGRWNSPGVDLIYSAENRSLAMAEVAVHLSLATLPDDYVMVTIHVPDGLSITEVASARLPKNWNVFPHSRATQLIGDKFAAGLEHCGLRVPSAVTKGDFNLLLNPHHPKFSKVRIERVEPFPFDVRIFK